jgi:hypothetical protein
MRGSPKEPRLDHFVSQPCRRSKLANKGVIMGAPELTAGDLDPYYASLWVGVGEGPTRSVK